jgi:hypothetical protein
MSHRPTKGAPKPATADLTAGGESLADLARERRDSRSYTIDYTGMGQQMIPAPTALVQNTQKQSKKYLSELKGSGSSDVQKARKLLRSLSVPFLNSWDFNSIDITSQVRNSLFLTCSDKKQRNESRARFGLRLFCFWPL